MNADVPITMTHIPACSASLVVPLSGLGTSRVGLISRPLLKIACTWKGKATVRRDVGKAFISGPKHVLSVEGPSPPANRSGLWNSSF